MKLLIISISFLLFAFQCVQNTNVKKEGDPLNTKQISCTHLETASCGPNTEVGVCKKGIKTCIDGLWSDCEGAVYPTQEICEDNIDQNCDGYDDLCTGNSAAIIIDHRHTDLTQVPTIWLEAAKNLVLHYAHTSHGSQVTYGAEAIESRDPRVSIAIHKSTQVGLPSEQGALKVYDGNPPETYITPDLYWASQTGIKNTQAVANTNLFDFSMWSWCGQASSYSEAQIQTYLDTMDDFETNNPGMRFILMTGHTDGGSATLTRNNKAIRDYAIENNKVLYDFADIESYDPAGTYYPNTSDSCSWCAKWCTDHPSDCVNISSIICQHSHEFNCVMKGRAFWWMMARLAGWDGISN